MKNTLVKEIVEHLMQTDVYDSKECKLCGKYICDRCDEECFGEKVANELYESILHKYITQDAPNVINVTDGDFSFEYGIVTFKHRFSINRSLNDYEETTLNKCIRIGLEYKYYTMACDKLIAELQIVYKDENNKHQCLKKDLHDWTFQIKHKGNMMINI